MTIFVALGGDVKEAARQLRAWVLRRCPHCGADKTREHDRRVRVVPLGGRARVEVEVVQWRYVCRNCERKTTPLPGLSQGLWRLRGEGASAGEGRGRGCTR